MSELIAENCDAVKNQAIIHKCDEKQLQDMIIDCNENRFVLVLLTSNGFRNHGYDRFVKLLSFAEFSIHIALLDQRDLMGASPVEWATRGFNANTGGMLAKELKHCF